MPPAAKGLSTNTVFIPCAGLGSRLSSGPTSFPKPLVDVGGLPAVARVILCYPSDWKFVIALGHDSDFIRQSLEGLFSRNERFQNLSFVYTKSFETSGQGLSHTILDASEALTGNSFVFHAVDSILRFGAGEIGPTWLENKDQIVLSAPQSPGHYRFPLSTYSGGLGWGRRKYDAGEDGVAYVGVCHVYEPSRFFARLEDLAYDHPEAGETLGILPSDCDLVTLPRASWLDIGSLEGLENARREFAGSRNVLPKSDEAIWFLGGEVVKVHRDPSFIAGRVDRARELAPFVPQVHSSNLHTYSYSEVAGIELSEALRDPAFDIESFFDFLWDFWTGPRSGKLVTAKVVDDAYMQFYKDKTIDRVAQLCDRFPFMNERATVNGHSVAPIDETLERIPWDELAVVTGARVHGDLHAENVIVRDSGGFLLLDWRQSVAGSAGAFGDIYYDLGKLAHGFRVDHGTVARGGFSISGQPGNQVEIEIESAPGKAASLAALEVRVNGWGLSWNRVLLMEAIIYLNIAALHQPDSYAVFLAYLGRLSAERKSGDWKESIVDNVSIF